jgi:hypothetical protein
MNPLLDRILVLTALAAAVGYMIWHGLRRKGKGGGGCDSGCGACGDDQPPQPPG